MTHQCRTCNTNPNWKLNPEVLYKKGTLYYIQFICEKCSTKWDMSHDRWSFNQRLTRNGITIKKLEVREEVVLTKKQRRVK